MAQPDKARVITASFVLTSEELGKAKNGLPPKKGPFYLQIGGILALIFYLFGPKLEGISPREFFVMGILLIALRPLFYWAAKSKLRYFSKLHPNGINMCFEFSPDGYEFFEEGVSKHWAWNNIPRIHCAQDHFWIERRGRKGMRCLPRHAFSNEAEVGEFLNYAKQAQVKISQM